MTAQHWDDRYATVGDTSVSWFQDDPAISIDLVSACAEPTASVVDVGGGASRLVDRLLARGHRDLTVVDLSRRSLIAARDRVGEAPVTWVVSDIRDWQLDRTFDVWHDRAAYHFLTEAADQQRYWQLVRAGVPAGGHVVIGTFAADGPQMCSGLPVSRYGADDLGRAMGDGFAVEESLREVHRTPVGGEQAFTWVRAQRL